MQEPSKPVFRWRVSRLVVGILCLWPLCVSAELSLSDAQAERVGRRIWMNETGGSDDKLLWWNEGEQFASLGIGHFIWFPANSEAPFEQSFPQLLTFMDAERAPLPGWLRATPSPACPWPNRSAFVAAKHDPRMQQLRRLLSTTFALQARFMAKRAERALSRMLGTLPVTEQATIRRRFFALASSAEGLYALVDYVNFKGYGTVLSERYEGEGWGLLQVLQTMDDNRSQAPVDAFASAAETVLRRRVDNAPAARNEQRWLRGWLVRVDTYRPKGSTSSE